HMPPSHNNIQQDQAEVVTQMIDENESGIIEDITQLQDSEENGLGSTVMLDYEQDGELGSEVKEAKVLTAPPTEHFVAPSAEHFTAPSVEHFTAPSAEHFTAPSTEELTDPSAEELTDPSDKDLPDTQEEDIHINVSRRQEHSEDVEVESVVKEVAVLTAPPTEYVQEPQNTESQINEPPKGGTNYPGKGGVVVVSLGGGEDEVTMLLLANLLHTNGHEVTLLLYGSATREEPLTKGIKLLEIPAGPDDPLYFNDDEGITPEDGGDDWAGGKIVASRVAACKQVSLLSWVEDAVKDADLLLAPLFLNDLCVLSLAERTGVPAVGILTSRLGAWWVWHNLGVTPPLSTTPVPPSTMSETGIWDRAANLARHYGYLSGLRQHWQAAATISVLGSWSSMPPLHQMYNSLRKVLVVWDTLTDTHSPTSPHVVNVGGFFTVTGHMTKDVLVPALLNRAGVITVSAGGREVWVGHAALENLYIALASTEFTVLWKNGHSHLHPNTTLQEEPRAKFVYRQALPLNDILSHPRHRLMISTCGESDVMAAVHFASPILCLPVTPDQHMAAREVIKLGIGEMVSAGEATVTNVKKAISKLMGKEKANYRRRCREVAEQVHDQPMAPADRLLFHIEHIIRNPKSKRNLRHDHGLYLLQQSNADVYLVLLLLLVTLFALLIAISIQLLPILLQKSKNKR
ncbi:unnamed protein product, partial [Meganyctiphanes norvegica]